MCSVEIAGEACCSLVFAVINNDFEVFGEFAPFDGKRYISYGV